VVPSSPWFGAACGYHGKDTVVFDKTEDKSYLLGPSPDGYLVESRGKEKHVTVTSSKGKC
jgi:hypothetical protein